MRVVLWTEQARSDLAAIRAFIKQDSSHYASVVVAQLIAATDRLVTFPESGRAVPEFDNPLVREVGMIGPIRSMLFVPGTRHDRFAKAMNAGADAVPQQSVLCRGANSGPRVV